MAKKIEVCNEPYTAIYLDRMADGYKIQPCCLYNEGLMDSGRRKQVHDINNVQLAAQQLELTEDTCINCISKERKGFMSKRLESLKTKPSKGLVRWDLRPGNTCNLKCAMCNPGNSSKWMEDIKIYEKYENEYSDSNLELDWDWIYSHCVDKAEFIYIAGGEPFYMKPVQKFLKNLSNHSWNCQNTHITIQTNGISNTPAFLEILSKFDKLHFSVSVDGWGAVNETIRFPTKHDELMVGIQELIDVNPHRLDYNITVQAMNLLNIDTLVEEFSNRNFLVNPGEPYTMFNLRKPWYLNINALKPEVIENANIREKHVRGFIEEYKYDPENNIRMQNYLLELDKARGTNSPKTMPWCFV